MENNIVLESAKFLKQLQEEAYKSITDKIVSNDNTFNVSSIFIKDKYSSAINGIRIFMKFYFNGISHEIDCMVEYNNLSIDPKEQLIKEVYSKLESQVREIISNNIINAFISKFPLK